MKKLGSFSLVLHAHLPYVVSHGTWPHGMDWLNEAAVETYMPLLNIFNRLKDEGIRPGVTIDISPVLAEMLASGEFKTKFKGYLRHKSVAAEKDLREFKRLEEDHMATVAQMWLEFYHNSFEDFTVKYNENILEAFKVLQDTDMIEITTCGATHGYFPLLSNDTSIQAQVKQAVASYSRHFGRKPRGIWLPECAYRPSYKWKRPGVEGAEPYLRKGVEEFLSENGIEYFYVDGHLLKGGKAIGVYHDRFDDLNELWKTFEKQYTPKTESAGGTPHNSYWVDSPSKTNKPVAVYARDEQSGLQVWSGEWGYPGDRNYLDFHKKRFPGGLRYWSVTDSKADLADKTAYHPELIPERIRENAEHFKDLIKETLSEHREKAGEPGIVVSPYDAELFGHWWFEGPEYLYHMIKNIHNDGEIDLVTGGEYLDANSPTEVVRLPEGSWGEGGYHWIWYNEMNEWTWERIYEAEAEMQKLAIAYSGRTDDKLLTDILKQTARELLLLQSSDWQFLISTRAAADYAELRVARHYEDFKKLASLARKCGEGGEVTEGERGLLELVMERDSLFPDIDPAWFAVLDVEPTGN